MSHVYRSEAPAERFSVARVLGRLGRLLMSAGVVTLAFVAYQLWGTGILQAQAQADLQADFDLLRGDVSASGMGAEAPPPMASPTPTPRSEGAVPTSAPAPTPVPTASLATVVPQRAIEREVGEVVGRLQIPRIELDQFIVEGVGAEQLQKGPGHYPGTPMPGMEGNAGLAGHRTTWGAPFHRIDELEPGDLITVTMPWGDAVYEVIGHGGDDGGDRGYFIVDPSDVWVLDQDGEDRLTLTSCHPKYSARQRIIVTARLLTEPVRAQAPVVDAPGATAGLATEPVSVDPVPTITPDADPRRPPAVALSGVGVAAPSSFGAGLSGDRSAIAPAIAWATAAVAMWWTTGFVARRWRPAVSYALAVAPLVVVWFVAFSHIDQAIPSY